LTEKPLHIVNASAGSGKTYHLVKEYVKLLISTEEAQHSFSAIIAMTFTNKAALEMKERIIAALDGIGNSKINEKHDLRDEIAKDCSVTPAETQARCKTVLEAILHRYEDFHVMTIDKFNLRLIKSFSRDLDIPGEFEVVMDESEVLEKVVDDLLNQLGTEGSETLSKLVLRYAHAKLEDESKWDFRSNLIDFGKVLKSERDNKTIQELLKLDLSTDAFRHHRSTVEQLNKEYCSHAEEVLTILDGYDKSALPGGGNTINDIRSFASKTELPEKTQLFGKRLVGNLNSDKQEMPVDLKSALYKLESHWEASIQKYVAVNLFLKNFFNMALLQYIARALDQTKRDEQIVRISEFNTLISNLIQDEVAPFIYERLGSRYRHYLLDEFQDTSHLQWLNLVPLVEESISQLHKNLIVGDPKQSIYRFKNGIAEQFVELPRIYNPDKNPRIARISKQFEDLGKDEELGDNWRSGKNIVKFNNTFFESIKEKMPQDTVQFYKSVHQNPKSKLDGSVNITSFEEKVSDEELLPIIIDWIEECRSNGFSLSDICILGRQKRELNTWAIGLNDAGYRVVSADSLLINSSLKVQLCIAYLQWRHKPSGENEKKRFAELFFRLNESDFDTYKYYIKTIERGEGKRPIRLFDEQEFLTDYFKSYNEFFFKYESLYDLIEGFYAIVGFDELENPYLHHLAEVVHEFGIRKGPNLKLFLDEYDRKKHDIAVQVPEAEDAIKFMTIHKSKGLEFPVVLMPSMNFKMDIKSKFLIGIDDYIIYKQPTKSESISPLIKLYEKERDQITTDLINLCYVGMTRPVERLYVMNKFEKGKFGALFHEVLQSSGLGKEIEDGTIEVELTGESTKQLSEEKHLHAFQPKNCIDRLWFPDIAMVDTEELKSNDYLSDEMQFGTQFHHLVSKTDGASEIDSQVSSSLKAGDISYKDVDSLKAKLKELFENKAYTDLLHNATDILNEQWILSGSASVTRPDKVIIKENETIVIDFKTGVPSQKDIKQVKEYGELFREMQYPKVSCYLYYSSINELRQISES
jgi:ATP-dependent exoDNAse (exonuclease V) beta subunit